MITELIRHILHISVALCSQTGNVCNKALNFFSSLISYNKVKQSWQVFIMHIFFGKCESA